MGASGLELFTISLVELESLKSSLRGDEVERTKLTIVPLTQAQDMCTQEVDKRALRWARYFAYLKVGDNVQPSSSGAVAAVAKHATIAFAKALTTSLTPDRGRDARGGGTEFSTNHSAAEVVDVAEATHVYVVVHDGTRVVLLTQRLTRATRALAHGAAHARISSNRGRPGGAPRAAAPAGPTE